MPILDWIVPLGGNLASKALETFSTETIKLWMGKSQSKTALSRLLQLYGQMSSLENVSLIFVNSLDEFIKIETKRHQGSIPTPDDYRWYVSWGSRLAILASEVTNNMTEVSKTIEKLSPQAEIYFSDVVEFLDKYDEYVMREEQFPTEIVYGKHSLDDVSKTALKLHEAVESLTQTRKGLADFIKETFPFPSNF